jgi:PAS domain S-box-containing protein
LRRRRFTLKEVYIIDGPMRGNSFFLKDGVTTIGRATDNDIRILDKDISRHHAQLIKIDDKIFVLDLASLQGVFVDGEPIDSGVEVEITEESRIAIGRSILAFQKQARAGKPTTETLEDGSGNDIRSLELLLNISNIFAQSLDPNELFDTIIDQVITVLKRIDRSSILLLDKDTGKLREVVSRVRPGHEKDLSSTIFYSRTIVRKTIDMGKPILLSDTRYGSKEELSDSIEKMNVRSIMCAPLIYKGETKGVVYVDTIGLPAGFRKDDLKVLTALSTTAAIAIENARLYEELRKELAERRRTVRDLQQARKELEKEIEQRTDELSKTIEFLKQEISDHMQAEEALHESEERYRSLFQESRDAVYITNHDGSFVEVNQSYLDLFGYTRKEIENLKAQDTYADPNDRSRFRDEIKRNGSVRNFQVRLRRKGGREMNCVITATARKTDEGRILGYHGFIREITEYEQAGKSLRKP